MSYRTIEQITSRGYEKVATFITQMQFFGIVVGVLAGAGLMGVVHNAVIGGLLLVLLAALGYLLTTEMDGMAPYERLTWRLRGLVRGAVQGRIITPDDLPGVVVSSQSIPITWAGSFVQPAPEPGQAPGLAVHPPSRPRPTPGGGTSAKEPAHAAL